MAPTEEQARQASALQIARKKATKARVQRYLKTTSSQLKEGAKSTLLLKGIKASQQMMNILKEIRALKAPHAKLLSKNNNIVVFKDIVGQQSLEFLMTKNDCALFAMATHNKKRPNNLILGRTFDRQLLDSAELGVTNFKSMQDYGGSVPKKRIGSKPLLLFCGDPWQRTTDYQNLQNLLTDFYRGDVVDKLVVTGVDHLIVFTAVEDPRLPTITNSHGTTSAAIRIFQRTYHVKLKKNPDGGSTTPVSHLTPCGPDLDLVVRRTAWADPALASAARSMAKTTKSNKKKNKNHSTNLFGETLGRLHLEKQNVDQMGGRKVKAIRRAEQAEKRVEQDAVESELAMEKEQMEAVETHHNND